MAGLSCRLVGVEDHGATAIAVDFRLPSDGLVGGALRPRPSNRRNPTRGPVCRHYRRYGDPAKTGSAALDGEASVRSTHASTR